MVSDTVSCWGSVEAAPFSVSTWLGVLVAGAHLSGPGHLLVYYTWLTPTQTRDSQHPPSDTPEHPKIPGGTPTPT